MRIQLTYLLALLLFNSFCFGQFAPAANQAGTTAIYKDSSIIVNWASQVVEFNRGLENIANPNSILASFGDSINALYQAEGNSVDVVSLGDNGSITLTFPYPIRNGSGPDFAIFENSFDHQYLEFAFVEVSSDGVDFVRFPAISNIQDNSQAGPFAYSDPTLVNNLAGKYQQGFGTPFDLSDLLDSTSINIDSIRFVKIIDVVGSIDPAYASVDINGQMINDPFPTEFSSSGFDLDGVGVIHQNNPLSFIKPAILEFNIYPNPSNNVINIQHNLVAGSFMIFDLSGQLLLHGNLYPNIGKIDISSLSIGQYYIRIISDEKTNTAKFIVVK